MWVEVIEHYELPQPVKRTDYYETTNIIRISGAPLKKGVRMLSVT